MVLPNFFYNSAYQLSFIRTLLQLEHLQSLCKFYSRNYKLESLVHKNRFYMFSLSDSFSISCVHSRKLFSLSLASEKCGMEDDCIWITTWREAVGGYFSIKIYIANYSLHPKLLVTLFFYVHRFCYTPRYILCLDA